MPVALRDVGHRRPWDDTGAPQGDFLIGQWLNGTAEIVLPPDVATAKAEVGWHPGS